MASRVNPFPIFHYEGPEYFCDRNTELSRLLEMFDNQRHGMLSSPRRFGKTGLIHHFQDHLGSRKKVVPVFVDVFATKDDAGFVNKLVGATVMALEAHRKGFLSKSMELFKRLKPTISLDPISGMPTISLDIRTEQDRQISLQTWAATLTQTKVQFQIAIDEFQQISHYEDTLMDAELRTLAQGMRNVHFLFSGSEEHLLLRLFDDSAKPLFASVEQMHLDLLDRTVYAGFIKAHFAKAKMRIDDLALQEILQWTRGHTYYTQFFCNKLYAYGAKSIDMAVIDRIKAEILLFHEVGFSRYRVLLSKNQWKLLAHVGLNNVVESTSNVAFLTQSGLSANSARQATGVLLAKGLLYQGYTLDKSYYQLVNVFFSRWLQARFDNLLF